jgi:hypothetical protein
MIIKVLVVVLSIVMFVMLGRAILLNIWYTICNLRKKSYKDASCNFAFFLFQVAVIYFVLYPLFFKYAIAFIQELF